MNPEQGILPGFEVYFIEPSYQWKPRPAMLAKVKSYFEGYLANRRDIYARRKHIAEKLGVSIRTLARYLAWLAAEGWIETIKRTARTAIRKVLSVQLVSSTPVPSSVPPIEGKPLGTKVLPHGTTLKPFVNFFARDRRGGYDKNDRNEPTTRRKPSVIERLMEIYRREEAEGLA